MQQKQFKGWPVLFRIAIITLLLCSTSMVLFSFYASSRLTDDFWKQLGIAKDNGTTNIKESFLRGFFYYYGANNAKNIAAGNRAAVAEDLLAYAKQYINSDAYTKEYSKFRLQMKPTEPIEKKARTKEEIRQEHIKEAEKAIKETEASMKTMTADLKKAMEPVLETMRKQLQDYKDPNNKMIEMMAQNEKMEQEGNLESYKEELKKWEIDYPENPKQIIKLRLQEYLKTASDVDFSAALVEKDGKKRFANPAYEKKSPNWKFIFRAGKEVNDVTRPFAQQWLSEL